MIELLFQLQQDEDGWPPAAVEGLWCEPQQDRYRVETCPLFVKGISVGDLIEVQQDERGEVTRFTVVDPSGNSTVWVIFWDEGEVEPTLRHLRDFGCDTTGLTADGKAKLCSVNVPAKVRLTNIDALLNPLEVSKKLSVAYPSIRHDDG